MRTRLVHVPLPAANCEDIGRECEMSIELYQNVRQTMGELRDIMRETGISWDFIQYQIEMASHSKSPLDRAIDTMDPYTTGPGRTLRDLPSNIW